MKTTHWLSLGLIIPGISLGLFAYKSSTTPIEFISPLSQSPTKNEIEAYSRKVVYGFLPYWSVKDTLILPDNTLTHLAYFGFAINAKGGIDNDIGAKRVRSDNFAVVREVAQKESLQLEAVFTIFNESILTAVLSDQEIQQKAIASIIDVTKTHGFSGINIDFEPIGPVSADTRNAFTIFIKNLRSQLLHQRQPITLSVDIYATASENNKLWDIASLKNEVDYFIVMAYDYHRPQSPMTGPVSPLYGAHLNRWSEDIMSNLKSLNLSIPASQIILGVPLYGYQWQSTQKDVLSHTFPKTGQTQTYQKIVDLLPRVNPTYHWDRDSMTPWVSFTKDDEYFQLHYENEASLGLKLDLVNQSGLGGVAIWALGYEGPHQSIWRPFQNKLNKI